MRLEKRPAKSRADKLRIRRDKQARLARSRAADISRNMAAKPLVVSRTSIGAPVYQRASTRVKRRTSFAVDKIGTELIIPGLPMVKVGWRLLSGTFIFFLSFMLVTFVKAPYFIVMHPEIRGLSSYEISEFENLIKVAGSMVYEIDPSILHSKLVKSYPEIMDLSVNVVFPSQVIISGRERIPVITWRYGESAVWVDKDGYLFPARRETDATVMVNASDAPPLSLEETLLLEIESGNPGDDSDTEASDGLTNKRIDKAVFDAVLRIGKQMPDGFILAYDSRAGIGWNDPRGWYVSFGPDLDNLDEKLMVYETLLKEFIAKNIQPSYISVENLHAPYYRME